jgi:hypothetical protein
MQTDRRTDAMKLIGVFQKFPNAAKNETQQAEVDKTNDGKDKIMKEVKKKNN